MKITTLRSAMKLVSTVSNPNSLTSLFKGVEIGPDTLRACSEFGNIELAIDETELDEPVLLECEVFNTLIRSWSPHTELYLARAGDKLLWETDSETGYLSIIEKQDQIPSLNHRTYPWSPHETFPRALIRAQLACQAATVSVEMFGVEIMRTGGDLKLMSRNELSLSAVTLEDDGFPADKITIRPPTPSILASILHEYPDSLMDVTDEGLFVVNDCLTAHLPVSTPLKHDLLSLADKYAKKQAIVGIDVEAFRIFLSRAMLIKDKHSDELIEMTINDGAMLLTQTTSVLRIDDFLLADGLDPSLSVAPVQFPMEQLLVPLDHVHSIVLNHLPKVLVFLGQDPDFEFVVSGRSSAS